MVFASETPKATEARFQRIPECVSTGAANVPSRCNRATYSGMSKIPRRRTSVSTRPRTDSVRGKKRRGATVSGPFAEGSTTGTVNTGPTSCCAPPHVAETSAKAAFRVVRRSAMVPSMSAMGICRSRTRPAGTARRKETLSRRRANAPESDATPSTFMRARGADGVTLEFPTQTAPAAQDFRAAGFCDLQNAASSTRSASRSRSAAGRRPRSARARETCGATGRDPRCAPWRG